jgi:hypothetical protein
MELTVLASLTKFIEFEYDRYILSSVPLGTTCMTNLSLQYNLFTTYSVDTYVLAQEALGSQFNQFIDVNVQSI